MAKVLPKMIDMAMSPAERAKDMMPMPYGGDSSGEPIYPYGLSLSLGAEEIAKLGLPDDIASGDLMELDVRCKVTCVSDTDTTSGKRRRIELQITHIGDEEGEAEKKPTTRNFYNKG